MDHFARFGLPRGYAVDAQALNRAYERLSFEHHPDLLANASPDEKQRAQRAAADLNEAYRILTSDSDRAAYLLTLLTEEARAAGRLPAGQKLSTEALPKNFLQEMFLLQEEVEEATGAAATALRTQVEARHRETLAERARLFDVVAPTAEALQAIQSNLNQEKYLLRLLERLNRSAA